MNTRPGLGAVAAVVLLAGCGPLGDAATPEESDTTEAAGDASSGATRPAPTEDCAAVLATSEVAAEFGTFGVGEPAEAAGLPSCEAPLTESPVEADEIQIIDVPAAEWAAEVGPGIDELRGQLDAQAEEKLEEGLELLEDEALDDATACEIFTVMVVEIQGQPAGATSVVNLVPEKDNPLAANAQSCYADRFVSVQIEGELDEEADLATHLLAAVDVVRSS